MADNPFPGTLEELIERLEDEEPKVRYDAAWDLVERCRVEEDTRGRFGMRFLTLLNDDSAAVRGQAVLGAILCDQELVHVDRVLRLLDDPSPGVRLQVIHTLAPLAIDGALDSFATRLEDPDLEVKMAAASALAASGDVRGIPVLVEALGRRKTREQALYALRFVAGKGDGREIEQGARKILGAVIATRFERIAAAALLTSLGVDEGKKYLVERMHKKGIDRPLALEFAGELGVREAEPLLLELASIPRVQTRKPKAEPLRGTALRALASLGTQTAFELCRQTLEEEKDYDLRSDAAEGLLLLGTPEAKAALERAAEEAGDPKVVRVVRGCLELFGRPVEEIRLYLPLSGEEVF